MTGKERRTPRAEQAGAELDTGGFLRPDTTVLAERTLIPEHNLVHPPPTRFTHELTADEPYWFDRPRRRGEGDGEPDGVLPAGTPVVLMIDGKERSRVVDPQGRYVEVSSPALRELPRR